VAGWVAPEIISVSAAAAQSAGCFLPPLLPGCEGPDCPDAYPGVGPYPTPKGRDAAVNLFAGGDFTVLGASAEAEGRVVVLGDFTLDKTPPSNAYNVGVVGVGSGVVPPNNSDFLIVGGNLTVEAGMSLIVGNSAAFGVTSYGGALSGSVDVAPAFGGLLVSSSTADDPYLGLPDLITQTSACWAAIPSTGTATKQGSQTVFNGDGSSPLQVFEVDFNIEDGIFPQGISFQNVPFFATILVNMTGGSAQTINANAVLSNVPQRRVVWNFATATAPVLTGPVQFIGSVVVASPNSVTTVEMPGMNGRFYTAGSLVHQSRLGGGGEEFHNYPFEGTLPDCLCP